MTTLLPKGRILFVDDEPELLAGLERSLRPTRHSWQCEYVSHPNAALDRLERAPFEVIVSDMRMPQMNGAEFLARAGQLCPDSVRLMLTGNADLQTAMDAVNCGHVFQFLLKPCEGERLIERLTSALFQHRLQLSERDVLRLKLEQADKMAVLGKLAAGLTHDLNNILGTILIQTELDMADTAGESGPRAGLKVVHESARRAAEITREINHLSRYDPRASFQRVNVGDMLEGAIRLARPLLGRKITVNLERRTPLPEILGAEGKLKHAVLNLLINARDAMPSGGTISINVAPSDISTATAAEHPHGRSGSFVCIAITDTGIGMSEATLRLVKESFDLSQPAGQGLGLGLFNVQRTVTEHEGWVEITSAPRQGTTIRLYLAADL